MLKLVLNSVVLKSIPDGCTVVGTEGRIRDLIAKVYYLIT